MAWSASMSWSSPPSPSVYRPWRTDQSNLFAMVKLYKAARNRGVKPIIGAELCVSDDPASGQRRCLVVLCQNNTGYRNLTGLLTRSYTDGQYQGLAHVHPQWLLDGGEGMILLSGGVHGDLGQCLAHDTPRAAERRLRPWLETYRWCQRTRQTRSGRRSPARDTSRAGPLHHADVTGLLITSISRAPVGV